MHHLPKTLLSLEKVSLAYSIGNKQLLTVLQEIDLEVTRGETLSIVGPSGSGKTSLLMLIAGLEPVTAGTLKVADSLLSAMDEDALATFRRKHVGIVFQNFHLIPTMTAQENVAIALEFSGFDHSAQRAADWLDKVGLGERLHHYPQQLSGGEQQRVALARAFSTEPDLLLADEPTGNLDSENGKNIAQLLMSLREQFGTTLLLITHDPALAHQAERQLALQDGKLVHA
ncbi:MAG: ABC transporter [Rickettsiales bacterium]|nr:ABC transporter [Rickettsiales bacterium]